MGKSSKTHKLYRCYWCGISLHWQRVMIDQESARLVVSYRCPICRLHVSELDYEKVDIEEIFPSQDPEKKLLVPPNPSWLYFCFSCGRYVPSNKVDTVIGKGEMLLYRCPSCGEEVSGEKTVTKGRGEQELVKSEGYATEENSSELMSFVFELEGDLCPECGGKPFLCRAERRYPLTCARCGATLIDFLCWFCQHGKDVSELDCCKIEHGVRRVTFCPNFRQNQRTRV